MCLISLFASLKKKIPWFSAAHVCSHTPSFPFAWEYCCETKLLTWPIGEENSCLSSSHLKLNCSTFLTSICTGQFCSKSSVFRHYDVICSLLAWHWTTTYSHRHNKTVKIMRVRNWKHLFHNKGKASNLNTLICHIHFQIRPVGESPDIVP